LAMVPFALPMVLMPRFVTRLADRISGRVLLTAGLGFAWAGNVLFWSLARGNISYFVFASGMIVTGVGAGILNGETVKVLESAVPPERAGMASGLASTTRFIGILVGAAALGAVLSNVARERFVRAAGALGVDSVSALAGAKRVTSSDLVGLLDGVPEGIRPQIHSAGLSAFAGGFAAASLLAAAAAAVATVLTFVLVRRADTLPVSPEATVAHPCKLIDCRHPI
jgi:MFS family permease